MAALEAAIETLEDQIETHTHDYSEITNTPDVTGLALTRKPDYDSGWVKIDQTKWFEHGLGLNVLVHVYGRGVNHEQFYTTQEGYGGDFYFPEEEGLHGRGFYWENNGSGLIVIRNKDDWSLSNAVRVQIWKLD